MGSKFWFQIINEELKEEMKNVTDDQIASAEPEEEIGPEDHYIGVLDIELRKFFFVIRQRMFRMFDTISRYDVEELKGDRKKELWILEEEFKTLTKMFNLSVYNWVEETAKERFPDLYEWAHIEIIKGWIVVWNNCPQEEQVNDSPISGVSIDDLLFDMCQKGMLN